MKQIAIITILLISLVGVSNAQICVTTGNVETKVNTSYDGCRVSVKNFNSYMVTVDWTIYGVKDGNKTYLSEGTTIVGSNDTEYEDADISYDEANEYDRLVLKATSHKCD